MCRWPNQKKKRKKRISTESRLTQQFAYTGRPEAHNKRTRSLMWENLRVCVCAGGLWKPEVEKNERAQSNKILKKNQKNKK